jgi:hypothetical protein
MRGFFVGKMIMGPLVLPIAIGTGWGAKPCRNARLFCWKNDHGAPGSPDSYRDRLGSKKKDKRVILVKCNPFFILGKITFGKL